MASSQATATLNLSETENASHSPSRKRPLNGLTPLQSSQHHANGFVSRPSNDRGSIDTLATPAPESRRRKRKKTRAFEVPGPTFVRRISTGAMGVSGRGVKLSTIPNVMYAMDKRNAKAPEIEFLHRLLFNSAGTVLKRKSNIRSFSGFVFQSEKERSRVRDKLMRSHLNLLKRVAALLDVKVKDRKVAKTGDTKPKRQDTEIEMAAEAFLGSDSLASEDMHNAILTREGSEDQRSTETAGGSEEPLRTTNGKLADQRTGSSSGSATGTTNGLESISASDEAKAERYLSRQKKEESARIGKEETVKAILSFLEMPQIPAGRINLTQRDKERKRQKKALEKAKAEKALAKKAEEKRKQLLAKKKAQESDEDGDEDLEFEAKPWIVLARERQERDEHVRDKEVGVAVTANGHS